eukprot:gene4393-3194_t
MRSRRGAKFSEFLSTYAILNNIGLHPTALVERRDSAAGYGIFARDACDANTCLLVVPSNRCCSGSVLRAVGTPLHCDVLAHAEAWASLDGGLISYLTGAGAAAWAEWCWRVALERHRSYSPLWGWLAALPSLEELRGLADGAADHCRCHESRLAPPYARGRQRLEEELATAYALLEPVTLTPPPPSFLWAGLVLLTRGRVLPRCWNNAGGGPEVELAVVPYADLVNGPGAGRAPNAAVEIAASTDELPEWYAASLREERGEQASTFLTRLFRHHYCVCVTLQQPVRAGEEVILAYDAPAVSTGQLSHAEEVQLSRLLKYCY